MITSSTETLTTNPISRFRLPSGVVDFAVSKNAPESKPPTINSAAVILRPNDIGPDQRHQAIAEPIRKIEKKKAKLATAARWLGGTGGDGISSNMNSRCIS